ncbi:MAG: FHIPEP family type III secretion protein [Promethearchaeota archaeon]
MKQKFSNSWLSESQKKVKSLIRESVDKAFDFWMELYCEALVNWRLDICLKLAQKPYGFYFELDIGETFFLDGTLAIKSEDYDKALKMLNFLENNGLKYPTDESVNLIYALLNIFIGRYYLYRSSNKEQAKSYFERAISLARDDGRPYAAMGSYYYEIGNNDEATNLFSLAIEKSPDQPDGYVGMGLIAEGTENLIEAKDWYNKAINNIIEEKDILKCLRKLLAKFPGSFYIQIAQFFLNREDLIQASDAINFALDLVEMQSINERIAYKIKGDILKNRRLDNEAAEAYHEAGKRFYWTEEYETAKELFYKVKDLKKDLLGNYWYLADTLRIQARIKKFPYVKDEIIRESLKVWDTGFQLEKPKMGWPYIARALISEMMAKIEKDKKACLWEAISYIECALTFNDKTPNWWAILMRIYSSLELDAASLQLIYITSGQSEDNITFLDQQAVLLTDIGEYESALIIISEIMEKQSNEEENTWNLALEGYNKFYLKEYEKALDIFENVIKKDPSIIPNNLWILYYCAICYRIFDSNLEALNKFKEIWKHYEDNRKEYMKYEAYDEFIDVAFYLDDLSPNENFIDFIFEMANKKLNCEHRKQSSTFISNLFLGLAYLKKAHLENSYVKKGKKYLKEAVKTARHKRHIDYINLLILELEKQFDKRWERSGISSKKLKKKTQNNNYGIKNELNIIQKLLENRYANFKYLSILEKDDVIRINRTIKEIEEEIKKYKEEGRIEGSAWIGLNATLVRWYEILEEWSINLYEAYEELFKYPNLFPLVEERLISTINLMRDMGNSHLEEGRLEKALNLFEHAIKLMELSLNGSQDKVDLLSRIGFIYFQIDKPIKTIEIWTRAIEIYKKIIPFNETNNKSNASQFIGKVCLSLLKRNEDCWSLWEIIEESINKMTIDSTVIEEFKDLKTILIDFFNQYYQLKKESASTYNMPSVVTPIAVEIGRGLIPINDEDWTFLNEYLPKMRGRIQEHMGVKIPGIKTRDNKDLSPNSYVILLNEIPVASGEVYLDMTYSLESLYTILRKFPKIPRKTLKQVTDPITGTKGCWIPYEYWNDLSDVGIKLWRDPMIYITRHLEAILYQNLDKYLGIQEVESLLYEWKEEDDFKMSLIKGALPDQKSKLIFTRILRKLVKEEVPVNNLKEILKIVKKVNLVDDNLDDIINEIRLHLKKQLYGNKEFVKRVGPIEEFEESLLILNKYNLHQIPPESIANILSIIRDNFKQNERNQVLVINRTDLRSLVREIIQIEFPNLHVMAKEELV